MHMEKNICRTLKGKCTGQELDIKEPPNQKNRATSTFRLGNCNLTYILDLLNNGGVINSVAQGTVTNFDRNLMVQNGAHVDLTTSWEKYLFQHFGFVKRRSSMKAKISALNFNQLQKQFCYDAKVFTEIMDIPACLVM